MAPSDVGQHDDSYGVKKSFLIKKKVELDSCILQRWYKANCYKTLPHDQKFLFYNPGFKFGGLSQKSGTKTCTIPSIFGQL